MVKAILFDFFGVLYTRRKLGFTHQLVRNEELLAFSQTLRPQYKVGLLSNMSAGVMDKFFTQDELDYNFDNVVISGDVEMVKPEPGIYKLAAKTMQLDPTDSVLIDDSPINCEGARRAGMQAVLYNSTEQVKRDLKDLLAKQNA